MVHSKKRLLGGINETDYRYYLSCPGFYWHDRISCRIRAERSISAGWCSSVVRQCTEFQRCSAENFANASQSIAGISQDYTKKLQAAGEDSNKVNSIRQEANGKMVKAVQDNNLKVDEFNKIGQSLQQNPDLLKRVQSMVQQQK
ncbi:DUF4168 domain-containing protein [Carnimonas bestiolae]|uniref:DUF4168 domain-containing protein n=1 Tax=Carnimonas bestiolae TaxID=3402172 RepID=UPI003EDC6C9F